ncbi:unnamed protein product [Dicrocoelium dendriticum]|nr:unnamed protein product [Dicrocoelium dendriticum]
MLVYRTASILKFFVCGHLGYIQFARFNLLEEILSWQHPSGCFSSHTTSVDAAHPGPGSRKLKTEQVLSDGCSSHMLSVAAGALSVYLRTFLLVDYAHDGSDSINLHERLVATYASLNNRNIPKLKSVPWLPHRQSTWLPSVNIAVLTRLTKPHGLLHSSGLKTEFSKRTSSHVLDAGVTSLPLLYTRCEVHKPLNT